MKKLSLCIFALLLCLILPAQISINTDGNDADDSAILDVQSTEKGFLPPRLSTTEMNDIQEPADGLLIFNTDFKRIMYYNGIVWTSPCDEFICGMPLLDERDGKIYNTVKIGDHCWMAENLNVGTFLNDIHTDNGQIEKHCYNNIEANCETYGGYYLWDEIMEYTTTPGTRGICPVGWHIPTDYEWCTLENFVDQGNVSCTDISYRGIDCGLVLKSTTSWVSGGNGTDEFGFKVLASGWRIPIVPGIWGSEGYGCFFWTSNEENAEKSWQRHFNYSNDEISRNTGDKPFAFNCRCVKD